MADYRTDHFDDQGEAHPSRGNSLLMYILIGVAVVGLARWWSTRDTGPNRQIEGALRPTINRTRPATVKAQLAGGQQAANDRASGGPHFREVAKRGPLDDDELATIELFRKCSASVVHITTTTRVGGLNANALEIPQGTGSGFVWDSEGHIVTNFHVLDGASSALVTLSDQSEWPVLGVQKAVNKDLAILRIDAPPDQLTRIPIGTSSDLEVGQTVYAIGNPFGLDQTLTTGVISGLGREIKSKTRHTIHDVIQTDAAINPGNSGGPLLDSSGRLIGVNTAIFSPSGAYAGIGFAIPVDTVNRIVSQLLEFGKVIQPVFGITLASTNVNRRLGGVLVLLVAPNSTCADAGIQPTRRSDNGGLELGDIITQLGQDRVLSAQDLFDFLDGHKVGDEVSFTVVRGAGTESPEEITLQSRLKTDTFE